VSSAREYGDAVMPPFLPGARFAEYGAR
jgi:hypothetical protein